MILGFTPFTSNALRQLGYYESHVLPSLRPIKPFASISTALITSAEWRFSVTRLKEALTDFGADRGRNMEFSAAEADLNR